MQPYRKQSSIATDLAGFPERGAHWVRPKESSGSSRITACWTTTSLPPFAPVYMLCGAPELAAYTVGPTPASKRNWQSIGADHRIEVQVSICVSLMTARTSAGTTTRRAFFPPTKNKKMLTLSNLRANIVWARLFPRSLIRDTTTLAVDHIELTDPWISARIGQYLIACGKKLKAWLEAYLCTLVGISLPCQ